MTEQKFPYVNHMNILYEANELIDVPDLVSKCTDTWYNQTLCQANDSVVRLGILHGEYHWHQHDNEDEFFFVLSGQLTIEREDMDSIILSEQQGTVIPKGMQHRPLAPEKTVVLMMETAGIVPTGSE